MDVQSAIVNLFAQNLKLAPDQISVLSGIGTLKGWDSVNHFRIVTSIERHFKIQFTNQELVYLDSIQKIIDVVTTRIRNQSSAT